MIQMHSFAPHLLVLTIIAFILSSTRTVTAIPNPLVSVATYDDINTSFELVYNITPSCPGSFGFGEPQIDERRVALISPSSIVQDGALCAASSDMIMVSEPTIRQPDLLTKLDLPGFRTSLTNNRNADALVSSTKETGLLVGWVDGGLTCSTATYPEDTIFFVIREATQYSLNVGRGGVQEVLSIPPFLRAFLIVTPNSNVCLLVDSASNANEPVTLTTRNPDGTDTAVSLLPGGVQAPAQPPQTSSTSTTSTTTSTTAAATPVTAVSDTDTDTETVTEAVPSPSPLATPLTPVAPVPGASVSAVPTVSAIPTASVLPSDSELMSPSPSLTVIVVSVEPDAGTGGIVAPETTIDDDTSGAAVDDSGGDSTSSPDSDDGSACFSGNMEVTMESGETKLMKQLSVGDRVLTRDGVSDVILFTHKEHTSKNEFLKVTTLKGHSLTISPGHYVYLANGKLSAASKLKIGDQLELINGDASRIISIKNVIDIGLFNPQTVSGSFVVNDVVASTYTTAIDPSLAHTALLAPVRWIYSVSPSIAGLITLGFEHGSPMLTRLLPSGPSLV